MILKTCSRSKVRKGPYRSTAHLARVRAEPCLSCGLEFVEGCQAHHLRLGLRTMGVRKPDDLAVPLCMPCHRNLHSSKEEWFWAELGVDPVAWCVSFGGKPMTADRTAALEAVQQIIEWDTMRGGPARIPVDVAALVARAYASTAKEADRMREALEITRVQLNVSAAGKIALSPERHLSIVEAALLPAEGTKT